MNKTNFENLRIYTLAEDIADLTWEIVKTWNAFAQHTIGRQFVNAADSIGANIAEGTGRSSCADNKRFARIARGSFFELKHWLRRAYKRNLLKSADITTFQAKINELTPKLSAYINSIGRPV